MWWGYHGSYHGSWFCLGFLFFVLIVGFIVVRILSFRNYGGCRRRWSDDADAILRKRLASGEIDEAAYQKLKEALKK